MEFLSGAASATTIIVTAIAIIKWIRTKKSGIYFTTTRFHYLRYSPLPKSTKVHFTFRGVEASRLYTDIILILNRTDKIIDDVDFVRGLFFNKQSGGIFNIESILTESEIDFEHSQDNKIALKNFYLKPKDGLILEVTHSGNFRPDPSGVLKDSGDIKQYSPARTSEILVSLAVSLILICVVVVVTLGSLVRIFDYDISRATMMNGTVLMLGISTIFVIASAVLDAKFKHFGLTHSEKIYCKYVEIAFLESSEKIDRDIK